jgi:hypothetical protein
MARQGKKFGYKPALNIINKKVVTQWDHRKAKFGLTLAMSTESKNIESS